MKVIFLDIDGVLNSDAWYHYTRALIKQNKENMFKNVNESDEHIQYLQSQIDDRAVINLNYLLKNTDAKIVLSSSWRSNNSEEMTILENVLRYKGLEFSGFLDITPYSLNRDRGEEIAEWLTVNCTTYDIESYCILDDDIFDILPEQYEHFIHVDRNFGLSYIEANKAFDILQKRI